MLLCFGSEQPPPLLHPPCVRCKSGDWRYGTDTNSVTSALPVLDPKMCQAENPRPGHISKFLPLASLHPLAYRYISDTHNTFDLCIHLQLRQALAHSIDALIARRARGVQQQRAELNAVFRYRHLCVCVCLSVCLYAQAYACVHACVYVCMHARTYVRTHTCNRVKFVCVCARARVCVCICMLEAVFRLADLHICIRVSACKRRVQKTSAASVRLTQRVRSNVVSAVHDCVMASAPGSARSRWRRGSS